MKTYVVSTQYKGLTKELLTEELLMSTHNICFCGEIRKNIMWISLLSGVMSTCFVPSQPAVLIEYQLPQNVYKPQHTLWKMHPVNSNQHGHLWCLISLRCQHKKLCMLSYLICAQWRFRSDHENVQADLNLSWVHMPKGMFSDVASHIHFLFISDTFTICLFNNNTGIPTINL